MLNATIPFPPTFPRTHSKNSVSTLTTTTTFTPISTQLGNPYPPPSNLNSWTRKTFLQTLQHYHYQDV